MIKLYLTRLGKLENLSTQTVVSAVALIDHAGFVLMQRRKASGEHGGLWEFPGGKVEPGESHEGAAVREMAEELGVGLLATNLNFIAEASNHELGDDPAMPGQPRKLVIALYSSREWAGTASPLDAEELGWFRPDQLAQLDMPPLDYPLARALCLSFHEHSSP